VLVIDDQLATREDLFAVPSETAPLSAKEVELREWMNVEIQFLARPQDYRYGEEDSVPRGSFDTGWFEGALRGALQDPHPIAAVLLDLLYGSEERIEDASGPKFLALLRQQLPDVPVLILSNVDETPEVRGIVKEGRGPGTGDVSFQDYLPKRITGGPGLLDRLMERLVEWGDISDPSLCAFSFRMRRLARQMRRVAMLREFIDYQENNARFPRPVIIRGPIGSGKNYIANKLHAVSDRRSGPYLRADFSGHDADGFRTTLFGTGAFTGAVQWYRVQLSDAAVLSVTQATRGNPSANGLYLGSLGLLHRVHIAEQTPQGNQAPFPWQPSHFGTLLFDEIGTAPQEMQTPLLRLFNYGRFTPHLRSEEIPAQGGVDVWFLVTLSPEGQKNLREDLRTRLGSGWWIDVPPLQDRREDVLPLALQTLGAAADDVPERYFNTQARAELESLSRNIQVRELRNVLTGLTGITAKPPYSGADLMESARVLGLSKILVTATGPTPDTSAEVILQKGCQTGTVQLEEPRVPERDALQILQTWSEARKAGFSASLRDQDQLRGKGSNVVGGAAVAVLSFLELCIVAQAVGGRYSATRTWNFFAGVHGTKAPDARTSIAPLFLIDEGVSLDMLRCSDALLWLALDVSKRRREVGGIIERLRAEDGQAARFEIIQKAEGSDE
jgi:DNA-binding NtrC family response regulator